jgi:hypothetical protein
MGMLLRVVGAHGHAVASRRSSWAFQYIPKNVLEKLYPGTLGRVQVPHVYTTGVSIIRQGKSRRRGGV